jgi:hypothetical protein
VTRTGVAAPRPPRVGAMARGAARRHGGVLSPVQERVGRIVTSLPGADGFTLARGTALVATRVVDALGGRGHAEP